MPTKNQENVRNNQVRCLKNEAALFGQPLSVNYLDVAIKSTFTFHLQQSVYRKAEWCEFHYRNSPTGSFRWVNE